MKKIGSVSLCLLFSFGFISWLSLVPVKKTVPQKRIESLYESPDDPNGASTYDFQRFHDPSTGLVPKDIRKKELAFAATLPKRDESSRSTQWQNRGPYNLGGRTRALALDINNENIMLAGQVTGGMWRSTDGGDHFTQTTQPGQLHSTTCVTQDTRSGHTNTWYYGTGEQYGVVNAAGFSSQFAGDGIFKSTDNGLTWAQLPSTLSPNIPNPLYQTRNFDFVWNIVVDPTNTSQDIVYAAVVNGIWRSTDGGGSWTPVLGLDTSITSVSQYASIAITPTGVLYATLSSETPSGGIYRSTDGITWVKIQPTTLPISFRRIEIGVAPSDETQVYFIGEAPGAGATGHVLYHYQYVSGDGSGAGGTWSNRSINIPHDHCLGYYNFDFRKYNSQNSYDMYIVVHPTDPNVVFLGGTDIYRSYDGFSSPAYDWIGGYQCDSSRLANYVYPGHHPDQHKLIFLPSNTNKAFSGTDGGIMRTDDIVTSPTVVWNLMNNGYNTGQFYTCALEPGNTNSDMIIGGLQDNGTYFTSTTDYTQAWPKSLYGDGGYCAITHGRNTYYMSIQQGKIFKMNISDNGTVNGLSRMDPTGIPENNYLFIAPFIMDPFDDNKMYLAAGKAVYRNDSLSAIPIVGNESSPVSQGWKALPGTLTGTSPSSPYISSLNISEAKPSLLYFGTDGGQVYKLDSCNTGTSTQKVNITGSNFPAGAYVSCVETDRLNENNILVTFSNYGVVSIFYSGDGGQNWANVSGNLEDHPDGTGNGPSVTWGKIYNDGTSTKYYVGTSIGLFSTSTLNGLNTVWAQEGANTIGNVIINMIQARAFDNNIIVATHGNGIYSNKVFTPSAIDDKKADQLGIICYPNPFSNSVVIQLSAETRGETLAEIFDISGKLVKKITARNTTQIIWDGNDLSNKLCAAGTYLVRITANGKSGLKKLVKM
ncbi:MAG: hypothetical protein JWO06_3824 [Bacteroidota bacterium]|nr:hypothetical protein [Bacteroidota bacterium]